jgi:hypothetical protein
MNRAARRVIKYRQAVHTLIPFLHSKRYWLVHRQNSHAPRGRRHTGRCVAQSRKLVKQVKNLPVL